jgi:hypothetical protein
MKPLQPHEIRAAKGHADEKLAEDGWLADSNGKVSGEFCRDENDGKPKNDVRNWIGVIARMGLSTEDGGQEQYSANDNPSTTSHGPP